MPEVADKVWLANLFEQALERPHLSQAGSIPDDAGVLSDAVDPSTLQSDMQVMYIRPHIATCPCRRSSVLLLPSLHISLSEAPLWVSLSTLLPLEV